MKSMGRFSTTPKTTGRGSTGQTVGMTISVEVSFPTCLLLASTMPLEAKDGSLSLRRESAVFVATANMAAEC